MTDKQTEEELTKLAEQIKRDQINASPAEKRVKIKTSFKKAIKKMGQTPPPTKKAK
jgi:hypothetical protein